MKQIFKKIINALFKKKDFKETGYYCKECDCEKDTYGSEPWGYFYYVCPKCKDEYHPSANEI